MWELKFNAPKGKRARKDVFSGVTVRSDVVGAHQTVYDGGKMFLTKTPEAEVFLEACEELGVVWCSGRRASRGFTPSPDNDIAIEYDGQDTLSRCDIDHVPSGGLTPLAEGVSL